MTQPTEISDLVKQLRSMIEPDDEVLRASLQVNGWVQQLPAWADENGVILVGNRRHAFAIELGIEPVISTVTFGTGAEADIARLRLAAVSNLGGAPMTAKDRKRIAQQLYEKGWTQQSIGDALGVSQRQVSTDLEGLEVTSKPHRPKGGRPKKVRQPLATPKLDKARDIVRPLIDGDAPILSRKLQDEHGISHVHFEAAVHVERAVRAQEFVADWNTIPDRVQDRINRIVERKMQQREKEFAAQKAEWEATFAERARARAEEMLERTIIPQRIKEAKLLVQRITNRKGSVTLKQFNRFRFATHPDTYKNIDANERNGLAQFWEELKPVLVAEKENPIADHYSLPSSVADLMKMREAATAVNRERARAAAAKRKAGAMEVSS